MLNELCFAKEGPLLTRTTLFLSFVFGLCTSLLVSCTDAPTVVEETEPELTARQYEAFSTLDMLQMNSDEWARLYSTFPNLEQPCFPADTSMTIKREELREGLLDLFSRYFTSFSEQEHKEFANSIVLVQEEYTLLICDYAPQKTAQKSSIPHSGIWVLPAILETRDLVLEW